MITKEGDPISYPDQYNHEGYLDITAYLATKSLERPKRQVNETEDYRRGKIYYADLSPSVGSEQGGIRPVIVVQNDKGNQYGPTIIIAPITSQINKRRDLPIHYYIRKVPGLKSPGVVLLEQIRTIDKKRVIKYLGQASKRQMNQLDKVLERSLGLKNHKCKDAT